MLTAAADGKQEQHHAEQKEDENRTAAVASFDEAPDGKQAEAEHNNPTADIASRRDSKPDPEDAKYDRDKNNRADQLEQQKAHAFR